MLSPRFDPATEARYQALFAALELKVNNAVHEALGAQFQVNVLAKRVKDLEAEVSNANVRALEAEKEATTARLECQAVMTKLEEMSKKLDSIYTITHYGR